MKSIQNKIFGIAFLSMLFGISSCISEHHFGKYDQAKILAFSLENQVGSVNIDHDALLITVLVDESSDIQNLKINTIEISSFATVSPAQGDIVDFSEAVPFTVTAENGYNSNLRCNCQTQSSRDSAQ
jgi:hypothetical protein